MTHVVAPSLKRVAKVLAALAAGTWIVSTEFLDASHAARTLVEPVCDLLLWCLRAALLRDACTCMPAIFGASKNVCMKADMMHG